MRLILTVALAVALLGAGCSREGVNLDREDYWYVKHLGTLNEEELKCTVLIVDGRPTGISCVRNQEELSE